MSKMFRLKISLKRIIKKKFKDILNRPNNHFVKQLKKSFNTKRSNKKIPPVTPKVAFKLADVSGDKMLDFSEFRVLLENMGLKISEAKALKIFASSDKGNSMTITYNEFLNCWEALQNVIVQDSLINCGFSKRNFVLALLGAGGALAILFSFLFLSVSAFGGAGSFGSSVRSAMALLASKLGTLWESPDPDLTFINKMVEKCECCGCVTVFNGHAVGGGLFCLA